MKMGMAQKMFIEYEVTRAGTMIIDGEEVTGIFCEVPKEELKSIPFNLFATKVRIKEVEVEE
jgi:hypothetical protein